MGGLGPGIFAVGFRLLLMLSTFSLFNQVPRMCFFFSKTMRLNQFVARASSASSSEMLSGSRTPALAASSGKESAAGQAEDPKGLEAGSGFVERGMSRRYSQMLTSRQTRSN